jgi:hypothetical protein
MSHYRKGNTVTFKYTRDKGYITRKYVLSNLLPSDRIVRVFDYESSRFPQLPNHVETLQIMEATGLKNIDAFPSNLKGLYLKDIHSYYLQLPKFPDSLRSIYIRNCWLHNNTVPTLPNSLERLFIITCGLKSVPPLPDSLKQLDMQRNKIQELPTTWPSQLTEVDFEGNRIQEIQTFPYKLEYINLERNPIASIPPIDTEDAPEIFLDMDNLKEPFNTIYLRYLEMLDEGNHNNTNYGPEEFLKESVNNYYKLKQGFTERAENLRKRARNLYTLKMVHKNLSMPSEQGNLTFPENYGSELGSFFSGIPSSKSLNQQISTIKQKLPEGQPYGVSQQPVLTPKEISNTRVRLRKLLQEESNIARKTLKKGGKRKNNTRKN